MDTKNLWEVTEYAERAAGLNRPRPPLPLNEERLIKMPRMWNEREVIERDSRINGGVYLFSKDSSSIHEALVVYDEITPELKAIYEEVRSRMATESIQKGVPQRNLAFAVTRDVLDEVMPYYEGVVKASEELTEKFKGQEMEIGENIRAHIGVCRHKALIAGYVVERLIDDGIMQGRVSVDRNWDIKTKKGHGWVRYTNRSGEVFIFDPMHNTIGTLKQAMAEGDWDYRRPEDVIKGINLPRLMKWGRAVRID